MTGAVTGDVLDQAALTYAELHRFPDRIRAERVSGTAGNGSVIAHADGAGELLRIDISEAFSRYADTERLNEYVLLALRRAELAADEFRAGLLAELAAWLRNG